MMQDEIASILRSDCTGNITADDFQDSIIECNNHSSIIEFRTMIVFSSESGEETASTLASRLVTRTSASVLSITLNGRQAFIVSACSIDCHKIETTGTSVTVNSSSRKEIAFTIIGSTTGAFFGGIVFCAILIAIAIVIR